jgi:PAS domain S-box-containing protein
MQGQSAVYLATGITSKKRGMYCSHPVYAQEGSTPLGVAVIKAAIDPLEKDFTDAYEGVVILADPHGVIFLSNRPEWLYRFVWKPTPEAIREISETRQFGEGPWEWTGLKIDSDAHATDQYGQRYVVYKRSIDNYPGWSVICLQSFRAITGKVSLSLIKMTGFVVATICAFTGLLILFLYWKGSHLIARRKAAEAALRESEETALALLNAPTESALLLDTSGTILAVNKTTEERFCRSSRELIGLCAFDLFSPEVARSRRAYHDDVVQKGQPLRYEDEREGRWLNTNVYPVFDLQGKVVRVAIFSRDVTDQRRAEEGLRLAKEELTRYSKELERRVKKRTQEITGILRHVPAAVFLKDQHCRYTLVNPRFEELFGISDHEIRGKSDHDLFPKPEADRFTASDLEVLHEGRSSQAEGQFPHQDGTRTYLVIKFPLYDEEEEVSGLCGIATDITPLKKAQDQLRRLSARIMSSQEKERTAIARELHDELGQLLTALRIDLVWILERLKELDPKGAERAQAMCELIDGTIDEVRNISIRLRPGVLDDLGLIPALEWYTSDFEKRTGITCRFLHADVSSVNDAVATAAYRIAQEALTNVTRHSAAGDVDVALGRSNGWLTLSIVDKGRGFNPRNLSDSAALGIAGMRERAVLVGGSLEIHSEPGKGTAVFFRVPIQGGKERIL